MSLSMKVTHKLSVEIGPRPPGSPEEKDAANYLDGFFRERGLNSKVTAFSSLRTFSLSYAVFYAIAIISIFLFLIAPWVALILASANFFLFLADINTFRIFSKLFNFWRSHNTVARQPGSGSNRRSIVLSAHLDSSRSGLMFYPPLVYYFRGIYLGGLVCLLTIPLLLTTSLITGLDLLWTISLLPSLFLLSGIILLLQREIWGRYTPGANDNASAVGVMAELADRFAKKPLHNCDLWFVGSGSEESGIIGMTNFLKSHLKELKDPLFINLESLGCGDLYYLEQEGMFPTRRADSYLASLAREIADRKDLPFKAGRFHTILTDNVAVLARKLPGLTLIGYGPRQLIPHWHQSTDLFENIDSKKLDYAVQLAEGMILSIDGAVESG